MKPVGLISTVALLLLLGAFAPAYAQQEQHGQDANTSKQEQQAKPKKQQQQQKAKGQQQQRKQQQAKGQQTHQPKQQQPQKVQQQRVQQQRQPQKVQQQQQTQGRYQDFCVNGLRFFLFESFFVPVKQPVAGAVGMGESRVFCEIPKEMWKA